MHIPDGFINATTAAATGVVSAGGVAVALRSAKAKLQDRQIPLVGVTAAFVFAAQMINFPVLPGVSGHLLGGALAAILLGPWMGALVLATVLLVQAIGFADGGITALGANISLVALVGAVGGHLLFRTLTAALPRTRRGFAAATALTAWATVVAASVVASFYVSYGGFAGPEQLGTVLPVMVGVHALIGVGEAFITTTVVMAVVSARPDLVAGAARLATPRRRVAVPTRAVVLGGVLAALALGAGLSHVASSAPDGLEASVIRSYCADAVDARDCLAEATGAPAFSAAPLPDYALLWLSGVLGVAASFTLGAGVMRAVRHPGRVQPPAREREREPTLT